MGRSHALCGVVLGIGIAGVLGHAPLPVRLLVIPVAGGAALLPDIDHPSSRVARSLGFVTRWIARGVAAVSLMTYHATRTDLDVATRRSGHRTLTHTVPGCGVFGVICLAVTLAHPVAGTVFLGLLIGLLAQGFKSIGWGFALAGSGVSAWVFYQDPAWWWLWPVVVSFGSMVHVLGDWCTNSGVPLMWPLERDGRRWGLSHAPVTFSTGKDIETNVVTQLLWFGVALAVGFVGVMDWAIFHDVIGAGRAL